MTRIGAAVIAGVTHFVLAFAVVLSAARGAASTAGGRCTDTSSCIGVNAYFLVYLGIGYLAALSIWAGVQARLLRRLLGRSSSRHSTAVVVHLVVGLALVVTSGPLSAWWQSAAAVVAGSIVPAAVTWWAASPSAGYVPLWRRPGW